MTIRTVLLMLVIAGAAALAQTPAPAPAADPLAALKQKTDFTDDDRTALREFVTQRVAEMVGSDPTAARQASRVLRQSATGGEAYRQALAREAIPVIAAAVPKSEIAPAAQFVTFLDVLNVLDARTVFVGALADERVGVRAAAAVGLRHLRPKLGQASPEVIQSALSALRDAASKERSREALRAQYQAISFVGVTPAPADGKPSNAALVDALEARAKLHIPASDVAALGAEDAAFPLVEAVAGSLSDDEKRRVAAATAGIIRYALDMYLSAKQDLMAVKDTDAAERVELRNSMERLVLLGERVLAKVVPAPKPPTVTESLRKLDRPNTRLQWKAWVDLLKSFTNQDFTLAESDSP